MRKSRVVALLSYVFVAVFGLLAAPERVLLCSFDRVVQLENTDADTAGVSVGDVNGDGRLDVVLGKGHHKPMHNRVLLNNGNGQFTAANLGGDPDRTYSARLVDVDLDGDLDVVVSNDAPDRKRIYKNDGKGGLMLSSSWGEANWPTRHISIADVNGDGAPDIIAANAGASIPLPIYFPSFLCLNDGTGSFPSCMPLPSESTVRIGHADFDGDGSVDLFVPHRDGGRNFILWNDGKRFVGRTSLRTRTFLGPDVSWIRVSDTGDLNGDGRPDIITCDDNKKTIGIYLNAGGQKFHEPVLLSLGERTASAVAVADINGDKRQDIVIGCYRAPGSVYLNEQDGRTYTEVRWNDGQGMVDDIVLRDMDDDGWTDIIAARTGASNGIWFNQREAAQKP